MQTLRNISKAGGSRSSSQQRRNRFNNESKQRNKLIPALLVFILLGIALWKGLTLLYTNTLYAPLSEDPTQISLMIAPGETTDEILDELVQKGIVNSALQQYTFRIYVKTTGYGNKFQAGTYNIPKDLNIVELVDYLQHAYQEGVWISFPEGLRADEYADICEQILQKNCSAERFNRLVEDDVFIRQLLSAEIEDGFDLESFLQRNDLSLEGFLFPDKYLVPDKTTEEEMITLMVNNFFKRLQTLDAVRNGRVLTYEDLIKASIVEREGRLSEDRRKIAGIIENRLQAGWPLEVDVTHLYYFKDWNKELTIQELQEDQPYNMRVNLGLPPTPICNPGLDAISAVLDPIETDYFFWIADDDDGKVYYARTLDEHNANVMKYLR